MPAAQHHIREFLQDINPEALLMDELWDSALVGTVTRFEGKAGVNTVACYNRTDVIEILMGDGTGHNEMDRDDAEEYFEFNIQGSYVGPNTPAFVQFMTES